MDLTQNAEQLTPTNPELAYNLLTGYRFAKRYVEGKSVADLRWGEVGYGTLMLAETAESVKGLSNSQESIETSSKTHPAPNVEYKETSLPDIPFPGDSFDVVVALGVIENLEHKESLLASIKHILKPDGTLVLSTPDKQAHSNERNRGDSARVGEMYVSDLRETLLRHFSRVSLYRQGAVAGGMIFKEGESAVAPYVESTEFTLPSPSFEADLPATDHVVAVCTDLEQEDADADAPYLLLDSDRRVFDEYDNRGEDTHLLQEEIHQMQETEVQAFQNALKRRDSELANMKTRLQETEARAQRATARLQAIEDSRTWRMLGIYRGLRTSLEALRK